MNKLISILKGNLQHDVYNVLEKNVKNIFLNPVGGWEEWKYDTDYFWEIFLHSRQIVPQFKELVEIGNYVEIGFSTIPFTQHAISMQKIGLVEHPAMWIQNASRGRYHSTPGDGMSWVPNSLADYARLWCQMTAKMESNCSIIYRIEDVLEHPNILLKHFNVEQHNTQSYIPVEISDTITDNIWSIVEVDAKRLGYDRFSYISDFNYSFSNIKPVKNKNTSVSVIIAARNNSEYLKDAILSAINQTSQPLEVIYIDDGSTDSSIEIVESFPDVKIIKQSHLGVCEARNKGALAAKGEYLLYLDGDDILPSQYIQNKLEAYELNPNASFIYGSSQAFGAIYNKYWNAPEWDSLLIWNSNFINTSSLLRKEHFIKAGMWQEGIGAAEDWNIWIRMIKCGFYGAKDPKGFLLYRQHPKSRSFKDNTKTNISEIYRLKFLIRATNCRIQISAVINNNIIGNFTSWITKIVQSIETYKNKLLEEKSYSEFGSITYLKPNLNIIYAGLPINESIINRQLVQYNDIFNEINIKNSDGLAKNKLYNNLMKTNDEIVWFIDSSTILNDNTMYELTRTMFYCDSPRYAVAGNYPNRVEAFQNIEEDNLSDIVSEKGCLMIFRPFASRLCSVIEKVERQLAPKPKVSIIVPVWNEYERIEQCLSAIQKQDFTDFEVIMVNDGSTDKSKSIMIKYMKKDIRFKYFENKENKGTGFTVNHGMQNCLGEYVTWFSADSWMYPNFISTLSKALDDNPDKILAYSDWDEVNEDGKNPVAYHVPEYDNKLLQIYSYIGPCCLYRKAAKDQAGSFCEDICEDYYMYLMLSYVGDFIRVPEVLGCWRNHKNNLTNRVSIPSNWYKSSVVKAKARWSRTKYKIAYLCTKLDAAGVGWWLTNVFNDLSDDFAVRYIIGESTHMTIGTDILLYEKDRLNPEALKILEECDIVHINNDYPDFNKEVFEAIKEKPIVIHIHANYRQWEIPRMKYWKEKKKCKVLTCTPGHEIAEWIPNFLPVTSNQKVPITYENYYKPEYRDNHKLKVLCHHNYLPGKGLLQIRNSINDFDTHIMKSNLKNVMEWSVGETSYGALEHLLMKKQYDVCIDTITHGYCGMATWESMSQGNAVICKMDEITQQEYIKFFGSIPPIMNVRLIDDVIIHLIKLINDRSLAKEMGRINREWMLQNYNAEKILDTYENMYKTVLFDNVDLYTRKTFWENQHQDKRVATLTGSGFYETIEYLQVKDILKPNSKVLEVGVGLGYVVKGFSKIGCSVSGVDISELALKQVTEYCDKTYLVSEIDKLPYNYFDIIICNNVVQHTPTDLLIFELKSLIASLKETGILALEFVSSGEQDDTGVDFSYQGDHVGEYCRSPKYLKEIINNLGGECQTAMSKKVNIDGITDCHIFHIKRKKNECI